MNISFSFMRVNNDKIRMGRVVCELLSTQICGPKDMNQI